MSAALVATIFNLFTPIILVTIIDSVIPSGQQDLLILYALIFLIIAGLYGLFDLIQRYVSALMAQHVVFDLRTELYESLLEKDLAFYDENETGQLLARVTTDVSTMREFLLWGYRVIFIGVVTMVGVYYVMWTLNQQLTLYLLLVLPAMYIFAKKVRPIFFASRTQFGVLSTVLQENIVGMKVVQSYASAAREDQRVEKENRTYLDLIVTANKLAAFYGPLLIAILGIAMGILLYVGGIAVNLGELTYGEFIGFVSLVSMLIMPSRFLSWGIGMYQRASAAAERTFYVLDARDAVMEPENPVRIDQLQGRIEFDGVDFSYRSDNYILRNVTLDVKPGEIVALLGGTGSGKTSLVNLIPRFYDADAQRSVCVKRRTYRVDDKGRVRIGKESYVVDNDSIIIDGQEYPVKQPGTLRIDGVDIQEYCMEDLRKNIGMIHQDPFLFSASIRENIAFARPDASNAEVEAAAKTAMIHEFIMTLEDGYDSVVGERGVTLSGGQRQRIAIARALLANPKILILDDSTSSVDAKTEMEIQKALESLMVNRTTFIITHRLSTIRNANRIVMLDRGRIVETGSHEDLLEKGGLYADLYITLREMEAASSIPETRRRDAITLEGSQDE
jgi:ATP-binding cassette subfamily B protein